MIFAAEEEDTLFVLAAKVETLLGPVLNAIHTLEADQPMLSYLDGLYGTLGEHFDQLSKDNPELSHGKIPADKRVSEDDPRSNPQLITLVESFERDRQFMWRPVMSAAAILDPLNWVNNGSGQYYVANTYRDEKQAEFQTAVTAFQNEGEDVESEMVELELLVFDKKYNKALDRLTEKTITELADKQRVEVSSHKKRVGFFQNMLSRDFRCVLKHVMHC